MVEITLVGMPQREVYWRLESIAYSALVINTSDLLLKVKTDEWNILWNRVSRFVHTCRQSPAAG